MRPPSEALRRRAGGILAVGCCFGGGVGVLLGTIQATLLPWSYPTAAERAYQVSSGSFMAVLGAVAIGAGVAIFRSVL